MNVSEALTNIGITPKADYKGVETNDDYILAIKTADTQKSPKDFIVCADHVKGYPAALNPKTTDNTYVRTGTATTKSGTQRTFAIEGDRYDGDDFQDFALSHDIKFGTGEDVIVEYVYFSVRSGKGESGKAAIIVSEDGVGNAGEPCGFKIDLKATETPADYVYSAATTSAT